MIELRQLLIQAAQTHATDVHLVVGHCPMLRVNTEMVHLKELPVLSVADLERFVTGMAGADRLAELYASRTIDFSTQVDDLIRFRVNAHIQRGSIGLSFHAIPEVILSLSELGLPAIVSTFTDLPQGLVLVTGQTGSGKSTTLAAIIEAMNQKYSYHIVTLEDPVEHLFRSKQSLIEQRELGRDVPSFAEGLRGALRQDPDVVMVGEMRDAETAMATITAAETGHLVFSSMHTQSPHQTLERVINIYPGDQQPLVRSTLASTLYAVVSQAMFRRVDRPGLVLACAVMICTPGIRNCIRDDRIHEIPSIIQTSRGEGMCTLEDSITGLFRKGCISRAAALSYSAQFPKLQMALSA
jgi:twitching motility protein PilT